MRCDVVVVCMRTCHFVCSFCIIVMVFDVNRRELFSCLLLVTAVVLRIDGAEVDLGC